MKTNHLSVNRRAFIQKTSLFTLGAGALLTMPASASNATFTQEGINIMGPKEGYSPHIGTLVSMMDWMRMVILMPVKGMSMSDLDYLVDDKANSIGAMLWHLAATERFYQIHTFENKQWGDWSSEDDNLWSTAMGLGDKGRKEIKGNNLDFYLEKLSSVRENTLKEFAKRDDEWLFKIDQEFPWGPTNNYCKWFHVCEHESNHNGQFKFIKSRLPNA